MQATLTFTSTHQGHPGHQGAFRPSSLYNLENCSVYDLLQYSQNGDIAARHALVGRYQSIIKSTASKMANSRQDAEDLASDIYLHIFSIINSCKNVQTLPGWIKRIAINEAYKNWRKKSRQPSLASLDEVIEASGDAILRGDDRENPAVAHLEKVVQEERSRRLKSALESLPEAQRSLCEMHYVKGLSFEDISEQTNTPIGTIKSRLFRARESMHRKLSDLEIG
jgi:RNA polymerase sigma-70 factor, ECF subfamily